jgi:hypothetical protein
MAQDYIGLTRTILIEKSKGNRKKQLLISLFAPSFSKSLQFSTTCQKSIFQASNA